MMADSRQDDGAVGFGARAGIALVRAYQATLAIFMGGHCRFHPSCSQYAVDALREWGLLRGSWLAVRRIGRCHPLGGRGFDPVPIRPRGEADRGDVRTNTAEPGAARPPTTN